MMRLNAAGYDFIKKYEGYRAKPYKDVAGKPTIGYGHLIQAGEKFGTINEQQAHALLTGDAKKAETGVNNGVDVPLTQNQFNALVSFTFNLGVLRFLNSTLLTRLNNGDYKGAAEQFVRWNKAVDPITHTHVAVPGLTNRRRAERDLFLTD